MITEKDLEKCHWIKCCRCRYKKECLEVGNIKLNEYFDINSLITVKERYEKLLKQLRKQKLEKLLK